MPFKEIHRRDSWPPTILRLHDEGLSSTEDIDSNPFAYFLTSPTPEDNNNNNDDEDFEYFSDLSAGIESPNDQASTPVREVSPSSLQRLALEKTEDEPSFLGKGFSLPLSLKDFSFAHESRIKKLRKSAGVKALEAVTEFQKDSETPGNGSSSSTPNRGRHTLRLTPTRTNRGRGRGETQRLTRTRSLSFTRPHSWREPSPDVWSIPEESEDIDVVMEDVPALYVDATGHDSSEPASGNEAMTKKKQGKQRKRVHWAELPTRDA